ncbi:MAG: PKD domain-containing protein [Chloroflexota bacterium]
MKQIRFVLGLSLLLVCVSFSPQQQLLAQIETSFLFLPRYLNDVDGATSALYVQNQGDGLAVVNITFYQNNGTIEAQLDDVIPVDGVKVYEEPPLAVTAGFEGSVVITSDQPVGGVVYENNSNGSIAAYRGVEEGTNQQYVGPFYHTQEVTSSLWIMNTGPATTTVNVTYSETSFIETANITPGAAAQFDGGVGLAEGYVGAAEVTASAGGEITGVVVQTAVSSAQTSIQLGQASSQTTHYLPHLFNSADHLLTNQRNSDVLLFNPTTDSATTQITFYNDDGSVENIIPTVVNGESSLLLDGASIPLGVHSGVVQSDIPLIVQEANLMTMPASATIAEYEGVPVLNLSYLPYLTTTEDRLSIITAQNQDANTASIVMEFYDLAGNLIDASMTFMVEPGASITLNLQDNDQLPDNFVGSGWVASSSHISARVSQYRPSNCEPITSLQINRMPAGDIMPGVPVTFTAVSDGTAPQHQWRINGKLVGDETATLAHTFTTSGEYTIEVTATNGCSSQAASITETVTELCHALTNPQIGRVPAGDIFIGDSVEFTAQAEGTMPTTYEWMLNGTAVGDNSPTLDYRATAPATYMIEVVMRNGCSEAVASATFSVRAQLFLPLIRR